MYTGDFPHFKDLKPEAMIRMGASLAPTSRGLAVCSLTAELTNSSRCSTTFAVTRSCAATLGDGSGAVVRYTRYESLGVPDRLGRYHDHYKYPLDSCDINQDPN